MFRAPQRPLAIARGGRSSASPLLPRSGPIIRAAAIVISLLVDRREASRFFPFRRLATVGAERSRGRVRQARPPFHGHMDHPPTGDRAGQRSARLSYGTTPVCESPGEAGSTPACGRYFCLTDKGEHHGKPSPQIEAPPQTVAEPPAEPVRGHDDVQAEPPGEDPRQGGRLDLGRTDHVGAYSDFPVVRRKLPPPFDSKAGDEPGEVRPRPSKARAARRRRSSASVNQWSKTRTRYAP